MRTKAYKPHKERPEAELFKKVRAVQLASRKRVDDHLAGEYQSAFRGRGMEFDQVREYDSTDDPRHIDWMVTARTGHPFVKTFVEERELSVVFLIDGSGSSDFGQGAQSRFELAVEILATLGLSGVRKNDSLGLLVFTSEVELFIPPRKGRKHFLRLVRELLAFVPQHRGTDLAQALEFCNQALKRRGISFLISDFLDPKDFSKPLRHLAKRQDLVCIETGTPPEASLSGLGLLEVTDLEAGRQVTIDTGRLANSGRDLSTYLRAQGADYLQVAEAEELSSQLEAFFRQRRHRR
ncbi:MAG: DUF58 domain-containing protein [bacterium]|nr:DUF58 domain-containing protein [bacterium]